MVQPAQGVAADSAVRSGRSRKWRSPLRSEPQMAQRTMQCAEAEPLERMPGLNRLSGVPSKGAVPRGGVPRRECGLAPLAARRASRCMSMSSSMSSRVPNM